MHQIQFHAANTELRRKEAFLCIIEESVICKANAGKATDEMKDIPIRLHGYVEAASSGSKM